MIVSFDEAVFVLGAKFFFPFRAVFDACADTVC